MKIPKSLKKYCKFCKKYTVHKITEVKTGHKRGTLKKGALQRAKKRGLARGHGNLGRWGSKPTSPKRAGAKVSKKTNLKFTCEECKKSVPQRAGFRTKRIELK